MSDFEKSLEHASDELRKIVIGLIVVVFGLAFNKEKSGFDLSSSDNAWLKYSLSIFLVYILIDIYNYFVISRNHAKKVDQDGKNTNEYNVFKIKAIVVSIGLVFAFVNLLLK
jgi:purine-cytosine permease-like protein